MGPLKKTLKLLLGIGILGLASFGVYHFLVAPKTYSVPSGSMIPTIYPRDILAADKKAYRSRTPVRGEIVFFKSEDDYTHVSRVVGIEGDEIGMEKDGLLILNGQIVDQKIEDNASKARLAGESEGAVYNLYQEQLGDRTVEVILLQETVRLANRSVKVPPGHVFVMGDNRDNARDSRYLGPVPLSKIIGRAIKIQRTNDGQRQGQDL